MASATAKQALGQIMRLAVTALIFVYLFRHIDLRSVAQSFARLPALALISASGAYLAALLSAVVRWKLLLAAYGARRVPRFAELARQYLVSMFYNLLPGAVGGDVLRGYASRSFFDDSSASSALGVVFVERVLGLAGLLMLGTVVAVVRPTAGVDVVGYALVGLALAVAAVVSIPVARRMSARLPDRLARVAASLPVLERSAPFAAAVVLAVFTHLCVSVTGFLILHALDSRVSLRDALVFFSVATLAAYFPLTIAGAGTRDAALVALFATRGVARADALACSLTLLTLGVLPALVGGLMQAPRWRREPATPPVASND